MDTSESVETGWDGRQDVQEDPSMDDGPKELASNWLSPIEEIEPEELGAAGDNWQGHVNPEDREDNGQAGPTQENGGLGLGDEEGLGQSGLTESGVIGAREHDAGGALDRLLQRESGPDKADDGDDESDRPRREPELGRDRLDTMIKPMYAEPNDLDAERDDFRE